MSDAAQVSDTDAFINMEPETAEPAEVEVKAEESSQAESAPAQQEQVEAPAEPDGVQKRINKITADKYEQKRRADALQQELEALKAQQQPAQASQAPAVEPKPEDFDYDDAKYQAALVDYKIEQRLNAQQQAQQQAQAQQRAQAISQGFNERVAEFVEKAPDYAEVVGSLPQLPQQTLDAVMQLDNGPQVAYYLGKHLDVADEIASSDPIMAAMKLGEIRAQLATVKTQPKPSAAPAPVETVSSGGSVGKSYEDMSMDELFKMR